MTLTIGSMFSGMGGLDLAVEAVTGAKPAWFCEWDDAPSKVLAHHWPTAPNYRDVTQIEWESVPRVDILTGGYPCQPFSHAGRREGTNDDRHLWPHVREAIRVLRPRLTILENVAGHRSLGFDRVLGDLAEDGADVWWTSLRASDIGAPHHRERLFIVASFPDPGSIRRERGQGGQARGRVSPIRDETISATDRPAENAPNPGSIGLEAGRPPGRQETEVAGDHDRERPLSDTLGAGWGERRGPAPGEAQSGRPHSEPDGRSDDIHWGDYAPAVRRWERVTRPAPAPTEPNRNGKPRLNAAFSEWMMGLPEGHVTGVPGLSRADQLKMIGNGVCPQQGAMALRELIGMMEETY